jgi:glycosyltransferase involved in cell wall biosynthesis
MSFVSVVIPCRNAARWLPETLASVLQQSAVSVETIVVDDGSEDGSAGVALAAGRDVRVIRQAPSGVSAARNRGTAEASGDFIQYLDADDVLEPQTLAARVAALDRTGADVALVDWTRWQAGEDGAFTAGSVERRRLGDRPDLDLLTDAWWPPGAILYRRSVVERVGDWRADLPVIQDARFLLDAALCGARFVHVEEAGLRYRVHDGSLSRRDPLAFIDDCYRNAVDLEERWRGEGSLDPARQAALVRVYAHVARATFTEDRSRFDEALGRALRLDPAFTPGGPPALKMLSDLIGYRRAEQVAAWWRSAKRLAAPAR